MSPASMKTHHGDRSERFRSTSVGAGRNGGNRRDVSTDRDRRHASSSSTRYRHDKYEFSPTSGHHHHFRGRRPQHHRKYGLAGLEGDGGGEDDDDWRASVGRRLTVPAPLHLQSSEGEEEVSWSGVDSVRMRRDEAEEVWEELNGPRKKTEIDVIKDWLVHIFQPFEKTADMVVTDFKFEQFGGNSGKKEAQQQGLTNGKNNGSAGNDKQEQGGGKGVNNHWVTRFGIRSPLQDNRDGDDDDEDDDDEWEDATFRVLKRADVKLKVAGKEKEYSVVIKVIPTDDPERHTDQRKFSAVLKFAKEVQVYQSVIHSMAIFDEKRYPAACVEPPVPKCFLSQLDAQNDVLVLENLCGAPCGSYRKYPRTHLTDLDHCRVVLRRLAHFHAISTLIQRDSEMSLVDLYPFAVEAAGFRRRFWARMTKVRRELCRYLQGSGKRGFGPCQEGAMDKAKRLVDSHLKALFWKLVELRSLPHEDRRLSVLCHGGLDLSNIVFQYDPNDTANSRPICAKFLDFSALTVSSPVTDISYFLHRAVHPDITSAHHATLVQHYHRAHTEAIKSFGMHGFELETETLLAEYRAKVDYGAMTACLLKPTLYVLQCINSREAPVFKKKGSDETTEDDGDGDGGSSSDLDSPPEENIPTEKLRISRDLVPIDLRLHNYLANLARVCPCACSVGSGSRELALADMNADTLAEELARVKAAQKQGGIMGGFDCTNGGTTITLKKLIFGGGRKAAEAKETASSSSTGAVAETKSEDSKTKAKGSEH